MTTAEAQAAQITDAFTLKGGVFTLTTVVLHTDVESELSALLEEKIKIAPKFFHNAPVVVDCSLIDQNQGLNFKGINETLRKHKLIPVGIRGVRQEYHQNALDNALAVMPESKHAYEKNIRIDSKPSSSASPSKENEKPETVEPNPQLGVVSGSPTKIITNPVRSGQQIYSPGGDLLVLAPVSPGAELLADGNIYVFGPLRGRALAGITGSKTAMIFCKSLEAELVSIAGQYKISEDLKETRWKQAARVHLVDDCLQFSEL